MDHDMETKIQYLLIWFKLIAIDENRPFPSNLVPLFQNEYSCKTFLMKISLICMKMNLLAELIEWRFLTKIRFNTEVKGNSQVV